MSGDEIQKFIGRIEERTQNLHDKINERTERMERSVDKLGDVVTRGFQDAEKERSIQKKDIRRLENEVVRAKSSIRVLKGVAAALVMIWGVVKSFLSFR